MTISKINSDAKLGALHMDKSRVNEMTEMRKQEAVKQEKTQETVKISEQAMVKQKQEAVNNPESTAAREKRIEELKAQIKSGEFKVDSKVIADKLLASTVHNLLSQ